MSLGPFPILLIPSTKNGKLQFWNDLTQQIIEADFSRPNTGATSGATVLRNGQLIELAEDDPDWDDADGCPVIKMRPQSENIVPSSFTFQNVTGATSSGPDADGFYNFNNNSNANGYVRFLVGSPGISTNDIVSVFAEVKPDANSLGSNKAFFGINLNGVKADGAGGGTLVAAEIDLVTGIVTPTGNQALYFEYVIGKTHYKIGNVIGVSISFKIIMQSVSSVGIAFLFSGNRITNSVFDARNFQIQSGLFSGYVPPTITRSSNSFAFTDLINKGVIAANGDFTVLINPYVYENAIYNTATIRLRNGNTQIVTLVMYPEGRLRVLDRINGGWITPNQNAGKGLKPIILAFNGATKILKVYFHGALQGTSPNLTLSIDRVEFNAPDDITYDLHDLNFSPIVLTDTEAIAELNSL
jgi:hypothetical protein